MSDFFFNEHDKEIADKIEKKGTPGKKYLKIQLSSLGHFSVPAIIHVKDYSGEDAIELSRADTNEDVLEILIDILNRNNYEGFDAGNLHPSELEEIMVNILLNWWSNALTDYPYPWEEDELEKMKDQERAKRIREGKEHPTIDIPLAKLKTENIKENAKEPITIVNDGNVYKFRVTRVKDLINAKRFIEEKYKREDSEFIYLEQDLEYNRSLDESNSEKPKRHIKKDVLNKYIKIQKKKSSDYLKAIHSALILYIKDEDGEVVLDSLKDQIENYNRIPLDVWEKYNEIVEEYFTFGIVKDLEITSPLTGMPVSRRFLFRYVEYLPPMGKRKESSRLTFSLGD